MQIAATLLAIGGGMAQAFGLVQMLRDFYIDARQNAPGRVVLPRWFERLLAVPTPEPVEGSSAAVLPAMATLLVKADITGDEPEEDEHSARLRLVEQRIIAIEHSLSHQVAAAENLKADLAKFERIVSSRIEDVEVQTRERQADLTAGALRINYRGAVWIVGGILTVSLAEVIRAFI